MTKKKRSNKNTSSPQESLENARNLMANLEFPQARSLAVKIVESLQNATNPDNELLEQALELVAEVEMEMGMFEHAIEHLKKACEILPDSGYTKFMYLGQLTVGTEAVQHFERGISLLEKELDMLTKQEHDPQDEAMLRRQISSALCSLTEMYMTDLCDEPDAEQRCENYTERAIQVDPTNAEAWQTMASVRISQSRPEDAKKLLQDSIKIWIQDGEPNPSFTPDFGVQVGLARMLLELQQWEEAVIILDILMKGDDQCLDVWYLYGWYYYLQGESLQDKTEIWTESREAFIVVEKLYGQLGIPTPDDEGMYQHSQQLLAQLNETLPPREESDDETSGKVKKGKKSKEPNDDDMWVDE